MGRVTVIFILLLIGVSSCKDNRSYWEDEKIANVLVDIHISEIAMKRQHVPDKDSLFNVYFGKIAHIHSEETDEIKKQVGLLMLDPDRMSRVYKLVIKVLQDKEKLSKRKLDKSTNKMVDGPETESDR